MWFHKFGYEQNPFELDPFQTSYTYVNHRNVLETLLYLVQSGSMFVIQGDNGTGKTMLLRQIIDNFRGKNKIVYLDGSVIGDDVDIESVINKRNASFLFASKPKEMILLLDNVDKLSKRNCEKIKYYFDQNYLLSVVFTTLKYSKTKIDESIKDRIMSQVIDVPVINKYDALRIVRNRFSDHFFLGDDAIMKIFLKSKKNIKKTLLNCEKVCAHVSNEGRGEVLQKYINQVLPAPSSRGSSA